MLVSFQNEFFNGEPKKNMCAEKKQKKAKKQENKTTKNEGR